MSQKSNGNGKGEFVVDLLDEDDDLDFHSDDEVEMSEDQRIMDELIRRDREREEKNSRRLRRSQTEENTSINSGDLEMNIYLKELDDRRLISVGDKISHSMPPKPAPRVAMEMARAATVPKKTDGTYSNCLPTYGSD